MNPINALSAVKSIGTATSDSSNRQQFQQPSKPGQTFTATVLESVGKNHVYLDIFGDKILAETGKVALPAGTKLDLEVLSTKPLLELKIISNKSEMFFGKTLTLLGKNFDISGLLQTLTSTTPSIITQLSTNTQDGLKQFDTLQQVPLENKEGGIQLKELIDRLGLNLEKLLSRGDTSGAGKTLKAALLEIATVLKEGGQIADTANRLLGTLELYQLAQLRLATENLLIFPLPLPFLDNGYLLVSKNESEENDNEEKPPLQFTLHLSLKPLGDLEISFLQTEQGIYIRFGCDSKEKKDFTNEYQNDLKEIISSTEILGITFTDNAGNPTNELIQQLVADGEYMLDTKI